MRIQTQNPDGAGEYLLPDALPTAEFSVSFALLVDCKANNSEPMTLELQDDGSVMAQWQEKLASLGVHKSVGGGVWERRINFEKGYRVYFAKRK